MFSGSIAWEKHNNIKGSSLPTYWNGIESSHCHKLSNNWRHANFQSFEMSCERKFLLDVDDFGLLVEGLFLESSTSTSDSEDWYVSSN